MIYLTNLSSCPDGIGAGFSNLINNQGLEYQVAFEMLDSRLYRDSMTAKSAIQHNRK